MVGFGYNAASFTPLPPYFFFTDLLYISMFGMQICRHCGGGDWLIDNGVKCISLACSVFYERRKVQKELKSLSAVSTEAGFYPRCNVEWF